MNIFKKFFRIIKCFICDHDVDWDEYDTRAEVEQHFGGGLWLYCRRCSKYIKITYP